MVATPLITLEEISLTFGGHALFSKLGLTIGPGERLCLVGRNGAGKSTLLRVMAGMIDADQGNRFVKPGTNIAYLAQEPDFTGFATLGDFAAADLDESERYKADIVMDGLDVRASLDPSVASGGEKRRAALARLLAVSPDVMLLDEPTNHLDIKVIEWLEAYLFQTRSAFVLISHDRRFMEQLTEASLWLDRGEARRAPHGFAGFEVWRDRTLEEERLERHKLNRLIKAEARWAVEGITARRKRNMGRVRRLQDLRAQRQAQIAEIGRAAMVLSSGQMSGKLAIEVENIEKTYDGRRIVAPFSTRIHRGDRVALIGPNGAGKTTLLRMLMGDLEPDGGRVQLGSNLEIATLDQNRAALNPSKTLWETMTEDRMTRVSGSSDQVMVRGRPQHVVGYLKSFLFDEGQARGRVASLSGGERARLLLAKLMARQSNLLVLDEPTNDLDMETLDLLQELLSEYDGTVLIVSHDRDFIDRVATSVIAPAKDGAWIEYAGGWSDYEIQRRDVGGDTKPKPAVKRKATEKPAPASFDESPVVASTVKKLTLGEVKRLEALPERIEKLQAEIERLEAFLADPDVYDQAPGKVDKAIQAIASRREKLNEFEEEWLELEARKEEAGG